MTKKVLVMAGTHQREIGFSHPVADLLLQNYSADSTRPQDEIVGCDGATRASVWDLGDLAVAKLYSHGDGEPTMEWYIQQSIERLIFLDKYRKACANQQRPPRIAETFGGEGQWTSVHDPLIQKYSPLFFIDLHSNHIHTEGQEGRTMQINSHAKEQLNPLISQALRNAQFREPEVYGSYLPPLRRLGEIMNSIALNGDYSKDELERLARAQRKEDIENRENNQWYFTTYAEPETRGDYFLFEAVNWGLNQQKATAHFIADYLVPEIQK